MTFEELNEVRTLKKRLADEKKKLAALKIVVGAFPHKYGKSEGGGKGGVGKSPFETFALQIADTERKIESLQEELTNAVPRLTEKIQSEVTDPAEQTLLIYRYVACEYFRGIGFLMVYSERRVYQLHEQIVKRLQSVAVRFS